MRVHVRATYLRMSSDGLHEDDDVRCMQTYTRTHIVIGTQTVHNHVTPMMARNTHDDLRHTRCDPHDATSDMCDDTVTHDEICMTTHDAQDDDT